MLYISPNCCCVYVCVLARRPCYLCSNDTICCCRGQRIWTYVHLAFDEQKLRPEERRQHLDWGIHQREWDEKRRDGQWNPVMTSRVIHSSTLIQGISASQYQHCQGYKQELCETSFNSMQQTSQQLFFVGPLDLSKIEIRNLYRNVTFVLLPVGKLSCAHGVTLRKALVIIKC